MWIASVPAAAAPLPGVAPAAAPPGDSPQFDDALAASLGDEQPAQDKGVQTPAAGKFKLVDWLVGARAVDTPGPQQSASTISSETMMEDEIDSAEAADEEAEDLPADVLLMAALAPPQPATEPVIVPAAAPPATVPRMVGDAFETSGAPRQDASLDGAADAAAAETAVAQEAPEGEVRATEPQNTATPRLDIPAKSIVAGSLKADVRSAGASAPAVTDAPRPVGAESPALPVKVSDGVNVDHVAAASVADARTTAVAKTPALPVTAEPRASQSASAVTAAAPLAEVPLAVADIEREARDTAVTMPRAIASAVPAANADAPMGGGDARSFENDGRRSPAAQRLAAALSKAAPVIRVESGGNAAAPAFAMPVQPGPAAGQVQPAAIAVPVQPAMAAAQVAPVLVTAPAAPTQADAENVHNLVEAMRITAKNGGWEATVRLKPEHLGEVTIALRVDGKSVSAVVHAESAGVRQWLTSQEEAIRSGLSEHGLQLDRFAVSRDGQRREAEQQQPQEQPRRRGQRQADAGSAPRFDVVV